MKNLAKSMNVLLKSIKKYDFCRSVAVTRFCRWKYSKTLSVTRRNVGGMPKTVLLEQFPGKQNHCHNLKCKDSRHPQHKVPMLCLVAKGIHTQYAPKACA